MTCLTCALERSVEVAPPDKAISARRRYEWLRAEREDRARAKLGTLGVVLARVIEQPQSTRAWKTGAEGEERAAKRLTQLLADSQVMLLHDLRMPGHGILVDGTRAVAKLAQRTGSLDGPAIQRLHCALVASLPRA